MTDYRNSDRCIIDDLSAADELWRRIQHAVPMTRRGERAIGINERLRFLRYDVGGFFEMHRDGSYTRGNELGPERRGETRDAASAGLEPARCVESRRERKRSAAGSVWRRHRGRGVREVARG